MFRRLPNKLPPDPVVPADLTSLGYFLTENDQIRQIRNPNQMFQVRVNKNERVNEVYRYAMNTCVRNIVHTRLLDLGLEQVRLPLDATPCDKHVPILVSKDLSEKKHVIVLFTDRYTDPGVISYRVTGDEGVNTGSLVNFVKAVLNGPEKEPFTRGDGHSSPSAASSPSSSALNSLLVSNTERPGLIIANPSQLIWYRGGGRAVSSHEWMSLPRESAVHQPFRIDEERNRIPGNTSYQEHIQYIFENILSAPSDNMSTSPTKGRDMCNTDAKISVIGFEYVGSAALQYIADNWSRWSSRIVCIALMTPQHTLDDILANANADDTSRKQIQRFIGNRTRAYRVSPTMPETPLSGRQTFGCNVYASGETLYEENVFVRCWPRVLDWIELCQFSDTYEEPVLIVDAENEEAAAIIGSPRRFQRQSKVAEEVDMDLTDDGKLLQLEP